MAYVVLKLKRGQIGPFPVVQGFWNSSGVIRLNLDGYKVTPSAFIKCHGILLDKSFADEVQYNVLIGKFICTIY